MWVIRNLDVFEVRTGSPLDPGGRNSSELMSVNTDRSKSSPLQSLLSLPASRAGPLRAPAPIHQPPRLRHHQVDRHPRSWSIWAASARLPAPFSAPLVYTILARGPAAHWASGAWSHAARAGAADDLPAEGHHGPARIALVRAWRDMLASRLWREKKART